MATADRIIAAANELLVAEGSAAVTMRRVATAVGLTPMAIYRHFPSRDVLLDTMATASFTELGQHWGKREWPTEPAALSRQMDEVLDDYLDFALLQPHRYAFLFTEQRAGARRFPEDFRSGASPTLSVLADALTAGMRAGLFRQDDVWELAMVISATLHGLVQLHAGDRIGLPDNEFRALCRTAVGRVLDGIRD
ncbi:MAG TPA: TetR/AcrR family transcriptional regulator [Pseudonocardiaceae bacterium]|nr:TetR/AcrR family transcriptional regulator [Pseudonocardiaceae bacterium]